MHDREPNGEPAAAALFKAFLTGAGLDPDRDGPERDGAERALREVIARAQAAWPSLSLSPKTVAHYLGERLAADPEALEGALTALGQNTFPETIHVEDLILACGCAQGLSAAIELFEGRYGREINAVIRQFSGPGRAAEDLRQILRERLFVAAPGRPPRIAEYRGTGTLQSWLRVTAVRAFLDERRRVSRREKDQAASGEALLDLPCEDDWELDWLKTHYRQAFRQAFGQAVRALTSEQRNLLRYQAVEGLTLDQIAALYPMHRSSVARRIQAARQTLLAATRSALAEALKLERREFDSIMALIQSRYDVSLGALLRSTVAPVPETRDD